MMRGGSFASTSGTIDGWTPLPGKIDDGIARLRVDILADLHKALPLIKMPRFGIGRAGVKRKSLGHSSDRMGKQEGPDARSDRVRLDEKLGQHGCFSPIPLKK